MKITKLETVRIKERPNLIWIQVLCCALTVARLPHRAHQGHRCGPAAQPCEVCDGRVRRKREQRIKERYFLAGKLVIDHALF